MSRIILEGVWDHIVSILHQKETPFAMWKELIELFKNSNDHRKLKLMDKLPNIKMKNNDTILQYLRKFIMNLARMVLMFKKMIW